MKTFVIYSTVIGGLYAQSDEYSAAVAAAKMIVDGDTWKRGYSGTDASGATIVALAQLKQADIKPVQFEGILEHVSFAENEDNVGNKYPKLRVGIKKEDEQQFLLSVDLKSDVAQRLISKLDNCKPGDYIRVYAWPTFREFGGRKFINHAVSVKTKDEVEVPNNAAFSAELKVQADTLEQSLNSAGITDKSVISAAKENKRVALHKELLLSIEKRFNENDPKQYFSK
jgi:hypothetical protein